MHLEPLRDYVVVRLIDAPQKPSGMVTLVRLQDRPSAHAEVLAVGPEAQDTVVGDQVIVSRLQGYQVAFSEPVVILREQAILAYLNGDHAV